MSTACSHAGGWMPADKPSIPLTFQLDHSVGAGQPIAAIASRRWAPWRGVEEGQAQGVRRSEVPLVATSAGAARVAGLWVTEDRNSQQRVFLRAMLFRATFARHRIRHGIRHTAALVGRRPCRCVANGRLRYMRIGDSGRSVFSHSVGTWLTSGAPMRPFCRRTNWPENPLKSRSSRYPRWSPRRPSGRRAWSCAGSHARRSPGRARACRH